MVLSWVVGVHYRMEKSDKVNVGFNSVGTMCFSEKYSMRHGCFKLIIEAFYGVFFIEN